MIDNPYPHEWDDLQKSICKIFQDLDFSAEANKIVETPRGRVEIDVYAIDLRSLEHLLYIVECKNWKSSIPQSVVHSFTTVMSEVGANIGFIISQKGLQSGAQAYTRNTNIEGLTYLEFQQRYFSTWYCKYFIPKINYESDSLNQYTEYFNSYRDRLVDNLSVIKKNQFISLFNRYYNFGTFISLLSKKYISSESKLKIHDIASFKNFIQHNLGNEFIFTSVNYRDLLEEIIKKIKNVTDEFNSIFGRNIFV